MKKSSWYQIFLLIVFLAFWIWSGINPSYRSTWIVENILTIIFIPIIILLARYFRLSNISYTCITIFMILHVIGSHYSYSEVPFGYFLQEILGESRNMYDRLVHFAFGLLFVYPIREVFLRIAKVKGFWGYYFPFDFVLAFSALYELIEYASIFFTPETAASFLGSQGDIWDAQKDMLMAMIGSIIGLAITAIINIKLNKNFWKEFKESFKINKTDQPLGEVKIQQLLKQNKK